MGVNYGSAQGGMSSSLAVNNIALYKQPATYQSDGVYLQDIYTGEMRHYLNTEATGGQLSQSKSVNVVIPMNSTLLNLQSLQVVDLNQVYQQDLENLEAIEAVVNNVLPTVMTQLSNTLNTIQESSYADEDVNCYYKGQKTRDQMAHIHKTFKNGRFEEDKRLFGLRMGTWFCAFNQKALRLLG